MLSNVRNKNRILSLLLLIIMLETQAKIVKEKNGSKIGKTSGLPRSLKRIN